ncbi:hypothetical protein [Sinosporangium siamense]|uniref:hypothetical protein n=1 Tax=Sinosporangium siamense TaxID=1367973 RepID=UPI00194FC6D2|nr:hypothetical protein [Sinosporangium siamense]
MAETPDAYSCHRQAGQRCNCDARPLPGHYEPEVAALAGLGRLLAERGAVCELDQGEPLPAMFGRASHVCRIPQLTVWDRGGLRLATLKTFVEDPQSVGLLNVFWMATKESGFVSLADDGELDELLRRLGSAATACVRAAEESREVAMLRERFTLRWEQGRLPGHRNGMLGSVWAMTVNEFRRRLAGEVTLSVHLPGPEGRWPDQELGSAEAAQERAAEVVTVFLWRMSGSVPVPL